MKDKKDFYSIAEFGKILGISRIAVYKKIKKGDIKAIQIGKSYAIPADMLESIEGNELNESEKEQLGKAVKKVFENYGETIKKLGKE